jgi:hypothetical protein
MFSNDASLDTVRTSVVRLPAARLSATDAHMNVLFADVGQGVYGIAPR